MFYTFRNNIVSLYVSDMKKIDFNANYIHGWLSISADISVLHIYCANVTMVATTCVIFVKSDRRYTPVINIMWQDSRRVFFLNINMRSSFIHIFRFRQCPRAFKIDCKYKFILLFFLEFQMFFDYKVTTEFSSTYVPMYIRFQKISDIKLRTFIHITLPWKISHLTYPYFYV